MSDQYTAHKPVTRSEGLPVPMGRGPCKNDGCKNTVSAYLHPRTNGYCEDCYQNREHQKLVK
ncbi:hypothetical protein Q5752_004916 [Cryptotrichosporon argae]